MKRNPLSVLSCVFVTLLLAVALRAAPYQMENLGRGVIAMRTGTSSVYVGWRQLGLDPSGISYNVYRGSTKVNASPITNSTNLVDTGATLSVANTYTVRPVIGGVEQTASAGYTLPANAPTQQYLRIALQQPAGGTTPDGVAFTYSPNDCSPGDLDGDGEYEIVVKWYPSNAKDNANAGYTGNTYLDAYKLNGTRLWRIDLGRNIRSGAHYTQFLVFDLDGDGKAEVCCKTADATISGTGQVIGNGSADYRNSSGYILTGSEFFTVFNGQTGAAMATANYNPPRGTVANWGDNWGNRVDRFNATVAYLDGTRPSAVMCRGYYTRACLAAWDWRNGQLTQRWVFDTGHSGGTRSAYKGQGPHSVTVGDVDADGRQEIVYGSCTIDDNGQGKYTTGEGHGDAQHLGDLIPSRAGLEYWMVYEKSSGRAAGLVDANTGAIIMSKTNNTGEEGPGRGVADDIYAGNAGAEFWGADPLMTTGPGLTNLYNSAGTSLGRPPSSCNFLAYWDADFTRELLDDIHIDKYGLSADTRLLTASGVLSNNGTKSTPCLSADLFGDWREEVIWRESGNTAIRIYTTTDVTSNRVHTLMHDPQYRAQISAQQSAYNQPPHVSFYMANGTPPNPNITYVGGTPPPVGDTYQAESATLAGSGTVVETINAGFNGTGYVNFPATGGTLTFSNVDGNGGGAKSLAIRFANGGTAARVGSLTVNGGTATSLSFAATGGWTTWVTMNVNITLNNNSTNTIQIASTGADLGNVDQISVP
ncbi:MAG TPA: carbohydrate-binding protein [Opitutaceae bacterium]|nr:carbohydrate-binding protein [Opitutaceae bacterium]